MASAGLVESGHPVAHTEIGASQAPASVPPPPKWIDADLAKELRTHDPLPRLPPAMRAASVNYVVLFEICVSREGTVTDVTVPGARNDPLVDALRATVRTWRYRPLVVNGSAVPFCHLTRIRYVYSQN